MVLLSWLLAKERALPARQNFPFRISYVAVSCSLTFKQHQAWSWLATWVVLLLSQTRPYCEVCYFHWSAGAACTQLVFGYQRANRRGRRSVGMRGRRTLGCGRGARQQVLVLHQHWDEDRDRVCHGPSRNSAVRSSATAPCFCSVLSIPSRGWRVQDVLSFLFFIFCLFFMRY
jgi:hypothetical protein